MSEGRREDRKEDVERCFPHKLAFQGEKAEV